MSDWTSDLKPGIEALVASQSRGPHLEPDEIAAYRAGELAGTEEERVRDHLVLCRDYAELLLALEALGDPDFGAGTPYSAADAAAVWEGIKASLGPQEGTAVVPFRRSSPTARPPRWLQALAAAALAAVVGLSAWVAALHRTVEELSRPQANAPVLDLYPEGSIRRGAGGETVAAVPEEARLVTLILNPARRPDHESFELELLDSTGEAVWRDRSLRPNEFGSFSVILPRSGLETGDYRIHLYGRGRGGNRERIGEYALQISP